MNRIIKYVSVYIIICLLLLGLFRVLGETTVKFYLQDVVKEIDDIFKQEGAIYLKGIYFINYLLYSDMAYKTFEVEYISKYKDNSNKTFIELLLNKNVYFIKREDKLTKYVFIVTDTDKKSYTPKAIILIDKLLYYEKIFMNILVILLWIVMIIFYNRKDLNKFLRLIGVEVHTEQLL